MLKKAQICQEICRKIKVSRLDPDAEALSKRELLVLNSYLDLVINKLSEAVRPDVSQSKKGGRKKGG